MPNGHAAAPMPSRTIEELADVSVARGYSLRRRQRVRTTILITLIVAIAGAALPFLLPGTRDVREGLVDTPERRRRATQADERADEQRQAPRGEGRVGAEPQTTTAPEGRAPTAAGKKPSVARGQRIAFVRQGEILLMDGDGSNIDAVTQDPRDQRDPEWSPDGNKLIFAAGEELNIRDVRDNTEETVTESPDVRESEPSFSADGRRIAFSARSTSGPNTQSDIYVMDADGGPLTRLTQTAATDETAPAWSPDGSTIAFARNGGTAEPGLFTMRADGSGVRRLTTGQDLEPSWSPSGDKLAFTRYDAVSGGPSDIYVMDADATDQRNLTRSVDLFEYTSDWSPDGKTIAFTRDDDGRNNPANDPFANATTGWAAGVRAAPRSAIYAMDADGSSPRALTEYTNADESPAYRPA